MKRISVLLAEDHMIVRQGLRTLLEADGDIHVVAEAATGREAVDLTRSLQPAVVVMDIAMPLLNGIEATRQILASCPDTRVLVLSAHSDDAYVEQVMAAGVAGYLLKQTSARVLCKAVRAVHMGRTYFDPSILRRLRGNVEKSFHPPRLPATHLSRLTSREVEVLQLVAEGKANKQVAAELGLSVKTVEKHRQSLMEKLQIHDTAGLTRYAIAAGVIESSVQVTIL